MLKYFFIKSKAHAYCVIALALIATTGCTQTPSLPNIENLYGDSAWDYSRTRNPLVTVPGILGSRLRYDPNNTLIWGGHNLTIDPANPEDYRRLALPIGNAETPLSELKDETTPIGVLSSANISILGISFQQDVYGGILQNLRIGGYHISNDFSGSEIGSDLVTNFQYAYDWRRDIVESAQGLYRKLVTKRDQIAQERQVNPSEIKFDIIAHSMGGLVTRYFLMYGDNDLPDDGSLPPVTWAGAKLAERVVFVAVPNDGSASSFDNLLNGKSLNAMLPDFPPTLMGTYPSVYQLMPRARTAAIVWDNEKPIKRLYDPALWKEHKWGLASDQIISDLKILMPEEASAEKRKMRASAHLYKLLKRAELFHNAMDPENTTPPEGLDLYMVVGGGYKTPAVATVNRTNGSAEITGYTEGDGVVARNSALLDQRPLNTVAGRLKSNLIFKTVLLLPDEHIDLTRNPVFSDNLLFWLIEEPRKVKSLSSPNILRSLSVPKDKIENRN